MERTQTSGLGTSRSTFDPRTFGNREDPAGLLRRCAPRNDMLEGLTKKPRPIGRGWNGRTRRVRQRILAKVAWSSARSLAFFVRSLAFVIRSASRAFLVLRVLFS